MVAGDLAYASRAEGGAVKGHLVWGVIDPEDEAEERVLTTIEVDGVIGPVRQSKRMEAELGEYEEADATWTGPAADFDAHGLPEPNTTVAVNGVSYFVLRTQADPVGAGVQIELKRVA